MAHSACFNFTYASGERRTMQLALPAPKLVDLQMPFGIFIQVTNQASGEVKYHEAKCPTDGSEVWGCPYCGAKETLEHREFSAVCAACQVIIEVK